MPDIARPPEPAAFPGAATRSIYPWVLATALFLLMFLFWGVHSSFGVFLGPLSREFGWSRGPISLGLTINLMMGGVLGWGVGTLTDRYGPRALMAGLALSMGLGFLLMSRASHLWQLYAFIGVLGGLGMTGAYIVPTATVSRWFSARRGVMLGVVLTGIGIAYMIGPLLAAYLIGSRGWRASYAVLGGALWLIALPLSLLLRRPPVQSGPQAAGASVSVRQGVFTPAFWIMFIAFLSLGFALMMVVVHLVPYATDRGLSLATASTVLTFYGACNILGRVTSGVLVDRLGIKLSYALCAGLQGVGILLLLAARSLPAYYGAAALFGLGASGADTVVLKAIPDVFGVASVGAFIGALSLGWRFGAASGPSFAGFVFDGTGTYAPAFWVALLGIVAGTALFLRLRLPGRPGDAASGQVRK